MKATTHKWLILGALALLELALVLALAPPPAHAGGLSGIFKMSKSREQGIAEDMNNELKKDPGLITEGDYYDLVQRVGKRIVERNNLDEYDYQFFVVKQEEVNAFATPAGYIYITEGLLDYMAYDEAMLAGVMSHELGHARDRHVAKGYEKVLKGSVGLGVLSIFLGEGNSDIVDVMAQAGGMVYLKYNRDQEEWADRAGVELNLGAGYDPYGMVRGLECLEALYGSGSKLGEYMSNHPLTDSRVSRTASIAKEMTGREHGYIPIPCPPEDHPLHEKYGGRCTPGADGTGAAAPMKKQTQPVRPTKRTQPINTSNDATEVK
jgi:predicted Zn-dependent protease